MPLNELYALRRCRAPRKRSVVLNGLWRRDAEEWLEARRSAVREVAESHRVGTRRKTRYRDACRVLQAAFSSPKASLALFFSVEPL